MDELLQDFIAETRETLEAVSGEIVAWEAQPDDRTRLDSIFRFVHTVKGSCGFLDLPRLQRLSHAAEDVLADVRSGDRAPDRALVNGVLAIIDRISEIVEAIDAGASLDDSGEDQLIAALAPGAESLAVAHAVNGNQRAASRSVRLNVDLLDRMMGGMSDMVLARNELARRLRDMSGQPGVEAALDRLSATVAEMRDTVTRTRMQKIESLFAALPRMVRDTAAELGKSVALSIEGSDVELDREMIEVMRDPLAHIIRNAIDHGLEAPAQRRAAGKRETGRLYVAARQAGNQIVIEISDDGAGIDTDRIVAKLVAQGRDAGELRAMSARARCGLIFEPGFTTKDAVSTISGRGVGMDVVRTSVEQIGGRIDLDNRPGIGLTMAIHVPLTLSIISTIIVEVDAHRFAIPRLVIEEIVSDRNATIRVDQIGDVRVATVRDRRLPMIDLAAVLGLASNTQGCADRTRMLVIANVGATSVAIAVDAVIDNEELVIKPAAPAVMAAGIYAGQTLPDTGQPMLLLDCAGIAAAAGVRPGLRSTVEAEPEEVAADGVAALLFEDLDGAHRLVSLDVVDRIEPAHGGSVADVAGRLRLTIDGTIIPLVACAPIATTDRFSVLRMRDGVSEVGYAIREANDIVTLPDTIVAATAPGAIAGAALIDNHPVELIDAHWIFATQGDCPDRDNRPLCVFAGDQSAWLRTFLKPMVETAGYRIASGSDAIEGAALVVTLDGPVAGVSAGRLLRLRSRPDAADDGDSSIYRYDRAALIAALAEPRAA